MKLVKMEMLKYGGNGMMKNRAKCKKCKSIIESFAELDYISCKCGEISIAGGSQSFKVFANDFSNFLRVDDEGNEIVVQVKENSIKKDEEVQDKKITREDILSQIDYLIKSYEGLPAHALTAPTTHADLYSVLLLLSASLRLDLDCK